MVKQLVRLLLDEAFEPALVYAEMVFLREPARRRFECEVMCLERRTYARIPREDYKGLTQDEAIQEVCSGVCAYSKSKA